MSFENPIGEDKEAKKKAERSYQAYKYMRRKDGSKAEEKRAGRELKEAGIQERKENEEYNIHKRTNLTGIPERKGLEPQENIIDQDNYNSPELGELVGGQEYPGEFEDKQRGSKFMTREDVPDIAEETVVGYDKEGDPITQEEIDLKEHINEMAEDAMKNAGKDPYDFGSIIVKLFNNIESKNLSQKQRDEEFDRLSRKVSTFISAYKDILESGLDEKEEYQIARETFKKIIGDVVYSSDEQVEILPGKKIEFKEKKLRKRGERKQKIYYDKRDKGFLDPNSARISSEKDPRRNNNRPYKKVNGEDVLEKEGPKAFNPKTGKKEFI